MEAIIQARYTNFDNDDSDYPNLSGLVDKTTVPRPRATKSSVDNAIRTKQPKAGASNVCDNK
jgi:hypothetical protein